MKRTPWHEIDMKPGVNIYMKLTWTDTLIVVCHAPSDWDQIYYINYMNIEDNELPDTGMKTPAERAYDSW